jgi:hypothetical protein
LRKKEGFVSFFFPARLPCFKGREGEKRKQYPPQIC